MAKLRLGIVGCGVIGPHHMQACVDSTDIDLVAVADLIEERGRAKAAEFRVPKVFREGSDLIRDPDVEAVVLAFPAGKRAELACQALKAGKHVLVEKPPAMRAAEIEKMLRLQGSLVGACCSSRYKFLPSFEAARAYVSSGALGEIREIYGRNIFAAGASPISPPPPWRASKAQNGGGILVNWSPYDLDYLLSIPGPGVEPRTAFAQCWPVAQHLRARVDPASDAESHYVALIRCEGGVLLHIERAEFSSLQTETAWQIIGSRASLRLHMTTTDAKRIFVDEADAGSGVKSRVLWEGHEDASLVHSGPVRDFAAAVLQKRAPKTDLRQALLIQRIFDAIYASASSGKAVSV